MPHFGIICPPLPGHVNPACALGRSLLRRGHHVTVFHVSGLGSKIQAEGLEFTALGADHFPEGALFEAVTQMKQLTGMEGVRFAVKSGCRLTQLILEHAPEAVRAARLDGLLVDQNEPAGGSVAEHLGIPFVSLCTSLPLNREPCIPPPFTGWNYSSFVFAQLRNKLGHRVADRFIEPIQSTLNEYRKHWNLPPLRSPNDSFSKVAEMAQMPREFDFPRLHLPSTFHYTGPWFNDHSSYNGFPFERLHGRQLIYGSLGTLQSSNSQHFHVMAEACSGLDVQLVLAVGGTEGTPLPELPGTPIVVNYAPQVELLKRAALTITHAGMNTTLQALHFGSPLIAVPLTHDQPAIAARLNRTGAGLVMQAKKLTVRAMREAICLVLDHESKWQVRARAMQEASHRAGGVERAADIVEQTILTRRARAASA
jgi:zeaxanthin glucosyltransferase